MSNISRSIKKAVKKKKTRQEEQLLAIADWWQVYGHNYPNFGKLTADPVQSLFDFMKSHEISVIQAAKASELFATEYSELPELPETD